MEREDIYRVPFRCLHWQSQPDFSFTGLFTDRCNLFYVVDLKEFGLFPFFSDGIPFLEDRNPQRFDQSAPRVRSRTSLVMTDLLHKCSSICNSVLVKKKGESAYLR